MSNHTIAHQPLLVLALLGGLMALTVSFSIDAEALGTQSAKFVEAGHPNAPLAFEMPTLAPSAIVLQGQPSYRMEPDVVKVYFAPSKTDIPLGADNAFHAIASNVASGQRVQIAGFHDETGNPWQNIVLSKTRAEVVKQRLLSLGVPADKIELKKPAVAVGSTDHVEARRVEVSFVN